MNVVDDQMTDTPNKSDIAAGGTIVDLARHRADLNARFPEVDDLVDRLSSDARSFARLVRVGS